VADRVRTGHGHGRRYEEHIIEVAKVLSGYVYDRRAPFRHRLAGRPPDRLNAFAKYATVPVINMETIPIS
jgi:ornithine carbamoyltransferase